MNPIELIKTNFNQSIELKGEVAGALSPVIAKAAELMVECLSQGNKILSCGNGGSASDSGHFVAEIVNRFKIDRQGLPAISLAADVATLTAIANDHSYDDLFSRQIKALGNKDDLLLAISTSGNSANIVEGIRKAHECGLRVIALTGKDGGKMADVLDEADIEIRIPSNDTARIQEVHILVIHCLCELIELALFKN